MLSILRNIRRSVLNSGATRKYILYALGEFVLIVAGILVAMEINNWNEGRKEQNKLDTYLQNLIEALGDDVVWFDKVLMINDFRASSIRYVLKLAYIEVNEIDTKEFGPFIYADVVQLPDSNIIWNSPFPDTIDRELVDKTFLWLDRPGFVSINYSVVNEMQNQGLISYIKNEALKKKIHSYYSNVEWQFSDIRDLRESDRSDEARRILMEKYSINLLNVSSISDPIEIIKNHPDIMSTMIYVQRSAEIRKDIAAKIKNDALALIDSLKNELENEK